MSNYQLIKTVSLPVKLIKLCYVLKLTDVLPQPKQMLLVFFNICYMY